MVFKYCFILLTCVCIVTAQPVPDTSNCKPCREHPDVNGPKFTVHGVMSLWNGTPSVRIWKSGTKRILGVSEGRFSMEGYCNLPKWLEQKLDWDTEIVGDFDLYPFTDDKPGVMRLVCVDTVYNMNVRPRK